jgi:hypothetical protein
MKAIKYKHILRTLTTKNRRIWWQQRKALGDPFKASGKGGLSSRFSNSEAEHMMKFKREMSYEQR